MWDIVGFYLSDAGGPYSRLAKMRADEVTIAVVEETFFPYRTQAFNKKLVIPLGICLVSGGCYQ